MSKSGERARPALSRFASDGKSTIELRRTLAQTQQQLQHEQESRERAESMTRAVDDFLAMFAHELRQPLAAALAAIEIQKHNTHPDRQERARRVIEQQVRYIARLVGDLSEVSKISRGGLDMRWERLDVRGLVSESVTMTEALFEERGHRVACALGDDAAWVAGDAVRLKQIFSNLLRNAAMYTPYGGQVRLTVDGDVRHVRVRVRDNGSGIPRDELHRIFELFNRGGKRSDGQSAGIGLAVVHRLVGLHGGTVTAYSDGIGCGSEFVVILPRDLSA
ncbi:MAG TPA: HAMP domain-containing sensor histidine kinase [Vicinamibacterales bacterium]|nr:HAMP domain-containing sensor histidine kinase [Vicinamibacterales bacterium]